jgi:carbamate kinase
MNYHLRGFRMSSRDNLGFRRVVAKPQINRIGGLQSEDIVARGGGG